MSSRRLSSFLIGIGVTRRRKDFSKGNRSSFVCSFLDCVECADRGNGISFTTLAPAINATVPPRCTESTRFTVPRFKGRTHVLGCKHTQSMTVVEPGHERPHGAAKRRPPVSLVIQPSVPFLAWSFKPGGHVTIRTEVTFLDR